MTAEVDAGLIHGFDCFGVDPAGAAAGALDGREPAEHVPHQPLRHLGPRRIGDAQHQDPTIHVASFVASGPSSHPNTTAARPPPKARAATNPTTSVGRTPQSCR